MLTVDLNKIIEKYQNKLFKFAYNHSAATANELRFLLKKGLNEDELATFFVEKYQAKKNGQPIVILDDLAELLDKIYQFNSAELHFQSNVNINSEDIVQDKTLGVYRILSSQNREMSIVKNTSESSAAQPRKVL